MPGISSTDLIAGRYRLDSVLGRGGMGEVRAGTDLRLAREVAIKLLRADLSDQVDLRLRFEREARAAARISHPNVVAVFDTGEHRGVPYIVMERLPGSTLADQLAAGTLSESYACTTVLEVLSALEAAHQLGILHRDIKPANILRTRDGQAKVTDFGIAKIAEDSDPATTGILIGTAAYLAPERLAGEPATPATDLYSVGVVLYEALAGRRPFRADTPLGLVSSIADGSPPPLAELRPDVRPQVIAVADRAMAKEPSHRFDSASAMAAALLAAIDAPAPAEDLPTLPVTPASAAQSPRDQPIPATEVLAAPEAPAETPRRSPRRPMLVWVAGALSLVLVVLVLLVALTSLGDDPAPSEPAPSSGTPGTTIPAPLRRAIDQLDRAVQP